MINGGTFDNLMNLIRIKLSCHILIDLGICLLLFINPDSNLNYGKREREDSARRRAGGVHQPPPFPERQAGRGGEIASHAG
jgi:hypothetical protein